jgi:ABC-type sugar transport system substrate-binding protein
MKEGKRLLAVLLALLIVFSLIGCTGTGTGTGGSTSTAPVSAAPSGTVSSDTGPTSSAPADTYGSDQSLASGFGLFRDDFDYTTMQKYRVVGMYAQMNAMYTDMDAFFQSWAKRTNCDYSMFDAKNDSDAFISALETYSSQGVDGVIINPDAGVMPRVVEVLGDLEMKYMAGFSPAVNKDNSYAHPFVGTDNYAIGHAIGTSLTDYAKTIDGFDLSQAAIVWMDWSTSNEVHLRGIGVWYAWDEAFHNAADAFQYIDAVSQNAMTEEVGYNLMSSQIVANKDIKYWFVATTVESFALGATRALEDYDLDKTSACCNNGADSLIVQWDKGIQTCYRAANAIQQGVRTNAYWNALYTFMAGWATPESIWPDCKPEGKTYAYVILEPHIVTVDTYKNFYGWGDSITGYAKYGYPYDGTTEYSAYTISDEYPMLWNEVTYDPTNGQFTKK